MKVFISLFIFSHQAKSLRFNKFGLRLVPQLQCPSKVTEKMWGLWIDGRDALKGDSVYDESLMRKHNITYKTTIMPALQYAYDSAHISASDTRFLFQARNFLGRQMLKGSKLWKTTTNQDSLWEGRWRTDINPSTLEVKECHKTLPPSEVKKIMSTVQVVDEHYCPSRPFKVKEYEGTIMRLFDHYSSKVESTLTRSEEIVAIAQLLQNLAFLHPLDDHNGRFRLVLLNYVLRKRNIACGAMMYNNNKNIYFETEEDYASRIEEGIGKYETAQESNFLKNPWQSSDVQEVHTQRFPAKAWTRALERCWKIKTRMSFKGVGEGATGSSPSFRRLAQTCTKPVV